MSETTTRRGDWMQVCSGAKFYPLDPRPEEIEIADIAGALSRICRFGGHVREFYSVAEHSVRVSYVCDPEDALWGLLHDAPEAFLGDMIRPLKRQVEMQLFREAEERVWHVICQRFGLYCPSCGGDGLSGVFVEPCYHQPCQDCQGSGTGNLPHSVEHADELLLATEARDLMGNECLERWSSIAHVVPLEEPIRPWSCHVAEVTFLHRFEELTQVVTR